MANASSRPALRSLETLVVPDRKHGKVIVLDPGGLARVADGDAVLREDRMEQK